MIGSKHGFQSIRRDCARMFINRGIIDEYIKPIITLFKFIRHSAHRILNSQVNQHQFNLLIRACCSNLCQGRHTALVIAASQDNCCSQLCQS